MPKVNKQDLPVHFHLSIHGQRTKHVFAKIELARQHAKIHQAGLNSMDKRNKLKVFVVSCNNQECSNVRRS